MPLPRVRAVSVVGGRPHLIKAESVHLALADTAFRHDVLRASLSIFSDYPCDRDFSLPRPCATLHSDSVTSLTARLAACLRRYQPDVTLLYGDLVSTSAALPAALLTRTPVVHVEAGYRSGDLCDAEESTRILTDHAAVAHLAYDSHMVKNLIAEGIPETRIFRAADPARLTLLRHLARCAKPATPTGGGLVTFHHDETFDVPGRLAYLIRQIEAVALHWPLRLIMYARTKQELERRGLLRTLLEHRRILAVETMRYVDYLQALYDAEFVVTDSSGVQDDCVTLGRRCIVVRRASPRLSAPALYGVPEIDCFAWSLPEIVAEALATPHPSVSHRSSIAQLRQGLLGALNHALLNSDRPAPPIQVPAADDRYTHPVNHH